jgi:hypothetical protein
MGVSVKLHCNNLTDFLNNETSYPQANPRFGMWITIFFASVAILCVCSLLGSLHAVRIARATTAWRPVHLASIESKLRSIESSQADTGDALMTLANKVKMQRVRTAANHINDRPDDEAGSLKDRLRAKAGLTAGQPARHQ